MPVCWSEWCSHSCFNRSHLSGGSGWTVSSRLMLGSPLFLCRCPHQTAPKYLQQLCVPVTTIASRHHCGRSGQWGVFWQQTQLRLWYTRWLLVALTTATACCIRSSSMPRKLYNQFCTRPLNHLIMRKWKFDIASHRHSEMIFTGCQCHRGLSTNSASLSTGDCIRLLQTTFKSSVCQSQPLPVAAICTQLLVVIYKFWHQELSLSGLAASLRVLPNFRTVYQPNSETGHWHLRNSTKCLKLTCFV